MTDLDLPSNLRYCDPDDGGCSTLFAPDLLSCPHCQREVTVKSEEDKIEEAPVTVTTESTRTEPKTDELTDQ